MLTPLDAFYDRLEEPVQSCFLALRDIILALHEDMTPEWKYKLPFFYLRGKGFCYLWKDKVTHEPYVGIMNPGDIQHPLLEKGDRKRVKIIRINPNEDIDLEAIELMRELVVQQLEGKL